MPDLIGAFNNFQTSIPGIYALIHTFAYLMSAYLVVAGILQCRHIGDARHQGGIRGPASMILTSAVFAAIPTAIDSVAGSVLCGGNMLCTSATNVLDYSGANAAPAGHLVGVRRFIQLVGVIAFMRGVLVLKNVGVHGARGKDTANRGAILMLAGILGVNIVAFLATLASTFGFSLLTTWATQM